MHVKFWSHPEGKRPHERQA